MNVFSNAVVIEVLVFEQIEILVKLRSPNELKLNVPKFMM